MRRFAPIRLLTILALAAVATTACTETTGPALNTEGLEADLVAASSAAAAPAAVSFTMVGAEIDRTLRLLGGGSAVADLPAALVVNPKAVVERAELRARISASGGEAAAIPAAALGGTFEYNASTGRYSRGIRTGAPANGVRFVLYAVDPATQRIVTPLVETGYADLTRSVTQQGLMARVEVWGGAANLIKALDYSVTVSGTIVSPQVLVAGFARNGTDSLAFSLTSQFSLATQTIAIDWRAAVPARGLSSRVQQSIVGGESARVTINGLLISRNGRVGIAGTIEQVTGGTLVVTVNGRSFATIALDSATDETPTVLNSDGQPLTRAQEQLLQNILEWFREAFDLFENLMDPVEHLLDIAF